MADVREFKCPGCGGKLEFDAATQQMLCPFCGGSFDPKTIRDPQTPDAVQQKWSAQEEQTLKTYLCRSCGGEIITEKTTAATHCPYCGNPVVMTDRVSGALRPDVVIPFQLTKQQAIDAMKKYIKTKRYAPSLFYSENRLKEIKGVYVPYWLFDSSVDADVCFTTAKTRSWYDSGYDYTETSYYEMERSGKMHFANVPVDGSEKMPDDLMDSLEPYRMDGAEAFRTAYLSGFFADKYDVDKSRCMERAHERMKNSAASELASTIPAGYSIESRSSRIQILPENARYALFPVWLLRTEYLGRTYTFAMNGQTGAFIGEVPISKKKLEWLFGSVAACVSAAVWAIGLLAGLYG